MSLRIIKSNPAGEDKEVVLEIDPVGSGSSAVQTYQVYGKVIDYKGDGVENITVKAYHKAPTNTGRTSLGQNVSNVNGDYLIYYTTDLLPSGKQFADLQVEAEDSGNTILYTSPTIANALPSQEVTLSISTDQPFVGASEYTRVKTALEPLLTGLQLDQLTIEDIGLIAGQTSFQATTVGDYIKAKLLVANSSPVDYSTVSDEVYYGLFRYGLPYDPVALIESSTSLISEAITATSNSNIIDPNVNSSKSTIINAFLSLKSKTYLIDPVAVDGESYIAKIMNIAGITDTTEQESFVGAYLDFGSDSDFWNVVEQSVFSDGTLTKTQKRDNLKAAFQVGLISQEYPPLVELVFADKSSGSPRVFGNINSIGEITPANWKDFITSTGGNAGVPNIETPTVLDEDTYVDALMTASEKAFPTEVLRTYMSNDVSYSSANVYTQFFGHASYSDFDIVDSGDKVSGYIGPRKYLESKGVTDQNLTKDILKVKRLWHLADGFDKLSTIKALEGLSLLSATQIASIGKRAFVKKYATGLGSAAEAERIFKVAVKRSSAAAKLQADHNPTVNNVSTSVFKDSAISQADVTSNASLDVLFGSQDYCACKHCRSSFSPAAYLIDLLTFLKQTQVYSDSSATTPIASNAWDIFKSRRPEFEKIELSCDNTNVVLPYIDLVNEVLENQVLLLNSATQNLVRQTTHEAESLRIRPEHLSKATYEYLYNSASVYPWSLPFQLWNEEGTGYLRLLDTSRSDLISVFNGDVRLSTEAAKVLIGVSDALAVILADNGSFQPYFDGKVTSTLQNVESFLEVTGLTYDELGELLETNYINPNNNAVTFATESCDLSTASLIFTTSNNLSYKRLHKFVRLKKLLNWSVEELDSVLVAFNVNNINDAEITRIAGVHKLAKELRLSAMETIAFYAPLSEVSYAEKSSQYDKVFLNPRYNTVDAVRATFSSGTSIPLKATGQLDAQHGSVVAAALRIKSADLLLLIESELAGGSNANKTATKAELAHLYALSLLIRALKVSVTDFLAYKSIINASIQPVGTSDPNDTIEWIDLFHSVKKSPFKLNDLKVLFKHENLVTRKLDTNALHSFLSVVRSKVQTRLSEKSISNSRSREDILNLFLIFLSEEDAIRSLEIVDEVPAGTITAANSFIDDHWTNLVSNKTLVKSALTASGGSLTDSQARRDLLFAQMNQSLVEALLVDDVVTQSIADHTGYDRANVKTLLYTELAANSYFTSADFISGTSEITGLVDYQNLMDTAVRLLKILLVLDTLRVSSRHISTLMNDSATTGWYDISSIPIAAPASVSNFDAFNRLIQAYRLETKYFVEDEFSIIDLITVGSADYEALSTGTLWNLNDLTHLVGISGAGMTYATNEGWLVKLQKAFDLLGKLGMAAEQSTQYLNVDLTFEQSQALQASVKANFAIETWQNIAEEVRDELRMKQRDVLAAYLIANSTSPQFEDVDDLYEYFLMDVEMAACMLTSRIKLAISSIQLWVQRIRMDLEPNIKFGQEELDEWEWRKNYRVWEAARKVFLYPENWLEPELRDDKSPFFVDLEDELLQDEVTMESAERAYLNYLTKLDDVAVLEISGIYREEDLSILHVFARTKNSPHIYYYRRQEDGFRWTAWEKIDLDIEGEHLIPVVFNRRPMIFWPIFSEAPEKIEDGDGSVSTSASSVSIKNPVTYAEVKIAYSEWKNNKWQSKKISKTKIGSNYAFIPSNYFFKVDTTSGELVLDAFYHAEKSLAFNHLGSFVLNNCSADLEVNNAKNSTPPATFTVKNAFRNNMKIVEEAGNDSFTIAERINYIRYELLQADNLLSAQERVILNKTPGRFRITYPVSGVDLLSEVPFFFEDKNRVFFVQPSEEEFEKEIFVQLPLRILKIRRDLVLATQNDAAPDDNPDVLIPDGNGGSTIPTPIGIGDSDGNISIGDTDDRILKERISQIQFSFE